MIPSMTRRGRSRRRKAPARATTNVYATSQVRVIAEKSAPSASRAKNAPSGATTNWGNTLGKNAAIFGLPTLLSSPCRSDAGHDRPGELTEAHADRRGHAAGPAAEQRVADRQGGVLAGRHDHEDGDREE